MNWDKLKKAWPVIPLVLVVLSASGMAFAESYHGLRNWALTHGVDPGWTANGWPLQVDAFILAGELGLLLSALFRWDLKVRALCWATAGCGTTASIIFNAYGDLGAEAPMSHHVTAAVPPIAATAGLLVVLSVIKRFIAPKLAEVTTPEAEAVEVVLSAPVEAVEPSKALQEAPAPVSASSPVKARKDASDGVKARRPHPRFQEGLDIFLEALKGGRELSERDLAAALGMKNRNLARAIKAHAKGLNTLEVTPDVG